MKKLHLSIPGHYCAGLGDCILWAWCANGPELLEFWAEGRNREILELMGCRLSDSPINAIDPHDCYGIELRERGARARVKAWCEGIGIPCEPKRPKMAMEFGGVMSRRVALCPHTHFKPREWPPAYWLDLNWELRNRNIDPIWIMEHDDHQYVNRGPSMAYHGYSMRDVSAMLGSSAVVIGNDSMPVHLAATIGRPAVALLGPTKPSIYAHLPDVLPMQSQTSDCVGCHFGAPFRAACDMMCQALMTLTPKEVAETVSFLVEKLNDPQRRISGSLSANQETVDGNQRRSA